MQKIPISNIFLKLVSSIFFKDYGNYHMITMMKISINKNIAPWNGFNSWDSILKSKFWLLLKKVELLTSPSTYSLKNNFRKSILDLEKVAPWFTSYANNHHLNNVERFPKCNIFLRGILEVFVFVALWLLAFFLNNLAI